MNANNIWAGDHLSKISNDFLFLLERQFKHERFFFTIYFEK